MGPSLRRGAFTLEGAAASVLLVHGLGGGPYELQRLGEALHAGASLHVEAPVLPGHEGGRVRMPASRHEDWCQAVETALERLERRGAPAHLVGFSTGAMVALRVAERRALSGKLVLLAPFVAVARPWGVPFAPEAVLRWFSFVREVPRRGPPLKERSARREVSACLPFRTFNLAAARSALELARQVEAHADGLSAPTLVLQGQKDTVVDAGATRRLVEQLSPRARLVELPLSDHLLALDVERERVFAEVAGFLAGPAH